ncbi:hypothetical protein [Kangiella shandongensis]|uniref:hypothetical protein n=1 Tax=Kangiella shandongensis TaxID=2763258 RepID=UPI001CBA6D5B|nr:hypothetical protein [Kangiella shandongensis]
MAGAEGEAFDAALVALFPVAGFVAEAATVLDHKLDFEVGGVELLPGSLAWNFGADADVVLFGDINMPQLAAFGAAVQGGPALWCPFEFFQGFAEWVVFVVTDKYIG